MTRSDTAVQGTERQRGDRLTSAFARLAWANLSAQSAEQVGLAAAPIVAVLTLGAGPGGTGVLQTAQTLPFLLLSIPAGVLADRVPRRRLMATAEALRTVSLLTILGLVLAHVLNLPMLALLGFAGACGTVTFMVTAPAVVPALVSQRSLPVANGRLELARTTAFAAGPALGGALVGRTGAATAFGLAAAFSAVAVLLLAGMPEPERAARSAGHPLDDLREGARFVFGHPLLRPIFVTQFVFNVAFFVLLAVFVPYAVRHLALNATGVGIALAAYGAGLVLGALTAARITRAVPFGAAIAIGPTAGLVAALLMLLTIRVPAAALAALSLFLIGAGAVIWVVSTTTLRQTVTPARLLARASALNIMAYGSRPIGAGIGALVGGLFGVESALLVVAAGFLIQALVIAASPVPRLVRQPEPAEG